MQRCSLDEVVVAAVVADVADVAAVVVVVVAAAAVGFDVVDDNFHTSHVALASNY